MLRKNNTTIARGLQDYPAPPVGNSLPLAPPVANRLQWNAGGACDGRGAAERLKDVVNFNHVQEISDYRINGKSEIAALLLAGCAEKKKTEDGIDVADANARDALAQIETLTSRIDELEQENRELKNRVNTIDQDTAANAKDIANLYEFDREVHEKFNQHVRTRYAHNF